MVTNNLADLRKGDIVYIRGSRQVIEARVKKVMLTYQEIDYSYTPDMICRMYLCLEYADGREVCFSNLVEDEKEPYYTERFPMYIFSSYEAARVNNYGIRFNGEAEYGKERSAIWEKILKNAPNNVELRDHSLIMYQSGTTNPKEVRFNKFLIIGEANEPVLMANSYKTKNLNEYKEINVLDLKDEDLYFTKQEAIEAFIPKLVSFKDKEKENSNKEITLDFCGVIKLPKENVESYLRSLAINGVIVTDYNVEEE